MFTLEDFHDLFERALLFLVELRDYRAFLLPF